MAKILPLVSESLKRIDAGEARQAELSRRSLEKRSHQHWEQEPEAHSESHTNSDGMDLLMRMVPTTTPQPSPVQSVPAASANSDVAFPNFPSGPPTIQS